MVLEREGGRGTLVGMWGLDNSFRMLGEESTLILGGRLGGPVPFSEMEWRGTGPGILCGGPRARG
mgnify:CR=1 FL=1